VHEAKPLLSLSYLGVAFQELAYQILAPSNLGSRLASLLGALLAASLVLGWLTSRGTPRWPAFAVSLVFLLDPIFNVSYMQGRVDSWAIAICIAACWLLCHVCHRFEKQSAVRWPVFLAGVLVSVSVFVWPTVLVLIPLVLLELFYLLRVVWEESQDGRGARTTIVLTWFFAGGLFTTALLLIPVALNWEAYYISWMSGAHIQNVASAIQMSIIDMYVIREPFVLIAVLASLLIWREPGVIIGAVVAVFMMYQTMIYPMRILYLLPYIAAIVAGACASLAANRNAPRRKIAIYSVLGLLIAWNVAITLVKRPVITLSQHEARSPKQIQTALASLIGSGPYRVLVTEWDMYYAARALGWKNYNLFGRYQPFSDDFKDFIHTMDFVILRDKFRFLKAANPDAMEAAGFELLSTISFVQPDSEIIDLGFFSIRSTDTVYEDVQVFRNPARNNNFGNQGNSD
jgi:hypothetical protein